MSIAFILFSFLLEYEVLSSYRGEACLKQNEKCIAQIAEYIPRAAGYAAAGGQSAPGEKIALYIDDGCDAAVLNAAFAPALNSHTRESFFSCIAAQLYEGAK